MDCRTLLSRLMSVSAPPLDAAERAIVAAHLDSCDRCREGIEIDRDLNRALAKLSRAPAPTHLRERIAAQVLGATTAASSQSGNDVGNTVADSHSGAASATTAVLGTVTGSGTDAAIGGVSRQPARVGRVRVGRGGWPATLSAGLLGACLAATAVLALTRSGAFTPPADAVSELVREAVNDHLRVVGSVHPIEIESGGIHQVKPWFTGRLEFAPRVAFSGDLDFSLLGGSVGYFRDRRAAVFSFKRRLHTITLLVLPHAGLTWPSAHPKSVGSLSISEETVRGFSVLFWRTGDLGYVLVSDVNPGDLELLAGRLDRE